MAQLTYNISYSFENGNFSIFAHLTLRDFIPGSVVDFFNRLALKLTGLFAAMLLLWLWPFALLVEACGGDLALHD